MSLAKPHGESGEWLGPARGTGQEPRRAASVLIRNPAASRWRAFSNKPLPVHATGAVQVDGARLTRMRCRTKDPHN